MKKYNISHEDIDTFLYVVEDSETTKNYLESIYTALFKREANRVRIPIEFKAIQDTETYPEVKILQRGHADIPNLATQYYKGKLVANLTIMTLDGNFNRISLTEDVMRHNRRDLVIQYTRQQFEPNCDIEYSEVNSNKHFGIIFHILPKNFTALRQNAKELGVEIYNQKELREKLNNTEAKFKEDPPRIEWGDFIFEIEAGKKQHAFCKAAFEFPRGEVLSWDIVADKMGLEYDNDPRKGRQAIYDFVSRINDNIFSHTKKKLFKWEESAFFREY